MSRTIKFLVSFVLAGVTFLVLVAVGWAGSGILPDSWPVATKISVICGFAAVIAGAVAGAGKYWAERPAKAESSATTPAPPQRIRSIKAGRGSVAGNFSDSSVVVNNYGDEGRRS